MGFMEAIMIISTMSLLFGIPLLAIIRLIRRDKLRTEERKLAMEKGIPIPEYPTTKDKKDDPLRSLRAGIVSLCVGSGILLFVLVMFFSGNPISDSQPFFIGVGMIISFYGLGKVIFYKISTKKLAPNPD